jgi:hypothetical protein
VDLKTSARVYAEHHLQTSAYMLALRESHGDEMEAGTGVIVAVGEDGSFDAPVCRASADDFLTVLACHRAVQGLRGRIGADERAKEATHV